MNKRVKKLWINALRSGKYKQGEGRLRIDNGEPKFCCLGVLCDLHSKSKEGVEWDDTIYLRKGADLPEEVCRWAGLVDGESRTVSNPKLGRALTASELNDAGKDFGFIADRIEKYL